jgi:hypothetical protein
MRRVALLLVAAINTVSGSSAHATIVISSDRGGLVSDYAARFLSARDSGEQVVIDGACLSACTLVVGLVKRDKVCATPNAVLGFHSAWRPMGRGKRVNSPVASEAMLNVYPAELRKWIVHRGGLGSKMIFLHGHELAEIVPSCGSSMLAGLTKSRNPAPRRQIGYAPRRARRASRAMTSRGRRWPTWRIGKFNESGEMVVETEGVQRPPTGSLGWKGSQPSSALEPSSAKFCEVLMMASPGRADLQM